VRKALSEPPSGPPAGAGGRSHGERWWSRISHRGEGFAGGEHVDHASLEDLYPRRGFARRADVSAELGDNQHKLAELELRSGCHGAAGALSVKQASRFDFDLGEFFESQDVRFGSSAMEDVLMASGHGRCAT
jgi:hypothetical protein